MQIIVHAGSARSFAIQSIRDYKNGNTPEAIEKLKKDEADLKVAHQYI